MPVSPLPSDAAGASARRGAARQAAGDLCRRAKASGAAPAPAATGLDRCLSPRLQPHQAPGWKRARMCRRAPPAQTPATRAPPSSSLDPNPPLPPLARKPTATTGPCLPGQHRLPADAADGHATGRRSLAPITTEYSSQSGFSWLRLPSAEPPYVRIPHCDLDSMAAVSRWRTCGCTRFGPRQ